MLNRKNKKFKVEIIEVLQRVVEVYGEDFEDACYKVENKYFRGKIVLDWSDYIGVEFDNFYLSPTVFKITKEEILEYFRELKINREINKNKKMTDKEMKKVLDFVECDELLAKNIRSSIKNSILEVIN